MRWLLALLVAGGGIFVWAGSARAQSRLTPDEYNALVAAVESTTPQPASEAPLFGNFYTITHGESWPPLPANTMGLNYWPLGGNFYLLDDRGLDYSASRAESSFGAPFPTNGGSGGGGGSGPDFAPQYTSNDLYLTNLGVISNVASLGIHPPPVVTNGVYDVLYATNLTQPIPWQWMLRTAPGQTNLDLAGATNAQIFYRLGPPNYWLAFPGMFTDGFNSLALYISSTVATSGNVMIRGQSNGPTVLVSGTTDDPDVNGTYVLTNLYIDPTKIVGNNPAFLNGAPVSNVYVKGQYVIFYDEDVVDSMGWVLANTNTAYAQYSGQYGAHNFNDVFWGYVNDEDPIGPTTSCAEYTLNLPFTVAASNVVIVPIPDDVMIGTYNTVGTNNAIEVNATAAVSIYCVDSDRALSATFTAYPMPLLGTNYCVMARPASLASDYSGAGYSEFAVVATENDTKVVIMSSSNADLYGISGSGPFTNILQQGETCQYRSSSNVDDVTGTRIVANKPVAVFAGASEGFVPDAATYNGNPLIQEQIQVEDWDTNVVSLAFAGRTNGDTYRVLASEDGTAISVTGKVMTIVSEPAPGPWIVTVTNETYTTNIDARGFFDIGVDGPVQFGASKPIQVAKFANGSDFDSLATGGDPCELLQPPISRFSETNVIAVPAGDFGASFVSIIVPLAGTGSTKLDETNVPSTNFAQIGGTGYYWVQIAITNTGAHTVISSQPAHVEVYGFGVFDAYGYFGGAPR